MDFKRDNQLLLQLATRLFCGNNDVVRLEEYYSVLLAHRQVRAVRGVFVDNSKIIVV